MFNRHVHAEARNPFSHSAAASFALATCRNFFVARKAKFWLSDAVLWFNGSWPRRFESVSTESCEGSVGLWLMLSTSGSHGAAPAYPRAAEQTKCAHLRWEGVVVLGFTLYFSPIRICIYDFFRFFHVQVPIIFLVS